MTRKKNKTGRYFALTVITLITLFITFLILMNLNTVFAQTVVDVNEVSKVDDDNITLKITKTQNKIEILTDTIKNQHKIVNQNKWNVENQWQNIHLLRQSSNNSWDALQSIGAAESKVFELTNEYKDSRKRLHELLIERSDFIKELKQLKKQQIQIQQAILDAPKPDNSHLAKRIGIILSESCISMIQSNLNSTCPSYKDLYQLDSSNTLISGEFVTDENGYFHRDLPKVKNSFRAYDTDTELRLFVDPPRELLTRIKLIEIRPNFDTYFDRSNLGQIQSVVATFNGTKIIDNSFDIQRTQEFTRILYHDRYIDSCKNAIINADKWQELLPITINYLRHNCDESKRLYQEKEIIYTNATDIDISTSQKYKDEKRLEWIKENCTKMYGGCSIDIMKTDDKDLAPKKR